jgi:hypothetical protein
MNKITALKTHLPEGDNSTRDSKYTDSAHAFFAISQPSLVPILFLHSSYALPSKRGIGRGRMTGSRWEFEPSTSRM